MNIFKQHSFSLAIVFLVLVSLISHTFKNHIELINIALIHLIPILIVALHGNMSATLIITTVSVTMFNFMYVPPVFSFTVHEFLYVWSFIIFYIVGYIITKQAQTLKIKTEEANMAKAYEQASELREILLNSVSHDLKTPLSSITAIINLMQTKSFDEATQNELLANMKDNASKMNRLISGLLDTARLQDKNTVLQMNWCDLEDVAGIAMSEFDEKRVRNIVQIKMDENLPLFWGDYTLLVQLFINLLDNALKYNIENSKIQISISQINQNIEIKFFNHAKPIPQEELEYIFDKFYRLKENGDINGSGIGLFICKSIAKAHSGNAKAINENGGVSFEISLPILKQPESINKED